MEEGRGVISLNLVMIHSPKYLIVKQDKEGPKFISWPPCACARGRVETPIEEHIDSNL